MTVLIAALLLVTALAGGAVLLARTLADGARRGPSRRTVVAFAAVAVLAALPFALRLSGVVEPRHLMFLDEPWYVEAGSRLAATGAPQLCQADACRPFPKPPGWPVVLGAVFSVTGPSDDAAFAVTGFLGALAALLAALVAVQAGGGWPQALLAGLLVAAHPLFALWSATAETNVPAAAFLLAGTVGLFAAVRTGSAAAIALAAGAFGFAGTLRPDALLAGVLAVPVLAWARRRVAAAAVLVAVGAAAALAIAALSYYFRDNPASLLPPLQVLSDLAWSLTSGTGFPLTCLVGALAMAGLVAAIDGGHGRGAAFLAVSAVAVALGSLTYHVEQVQERMLLPSLALLAPLAGLALPRFPRRRWLAPVAFAAVAAVAVVPVLPDWQRVARPGPAHHLETRMPGLLRAFPFPAGSTVVAEWATIADPARAAGARVVEARDAAALVGRAVRGESPDPVYLLCDMFCETEAGRGLSSGACADLLLTVDLAPAAAIEDRGRRYGLFRVTGPAVPGRPAPCPHIPDDNR